MILYLVRHGQSEYNAQGRIQGQFDTPLSELGRQQAAATARALAARRVDAVITSPLSRARTTAEVVAEHLDLPLEVEQDLQEIHAGIFQGRLWSEIDDTHPEEAHLWKQQDPDFVIPGGESRRQLMHRGAAVLRRIRDAGPRAVVVVSHGGLLSAALKALLEIPAERNPFAFFNCSISQLGWGDQLKLVTFNEIAHLQQIGTQQASLEGTF